MKRVKVKHFEGLAVLKRLLMALNPNTFNNTSGIEKPFFDFDELRVI